MNDIIQEALDTPDYNLTPEQAVIANLYGRVRQIHHSMKMALVPGNDKRREIVLTHNIAAHVLGLPEHKGY